MSWDTIVEVEKPAELADATPIVDEVPAGTRMRIEVNGWGLGKLADVAGAEWFAQKLVDADVTVIDVKGYGWSDAIVEMVAGKEEQEQYQAQFAFVILIPLLKILAITLAVLPFGLASFIKSIKVKGENIRVGDGGSGGFFDFLKAPLMLAVVGGVVILYLSSRKKVKEAKAEE